MARDGIRETEPAETRAADLSRREVLRRKALRAARVGARAILGLLSLTWIGGCTISTVVEDTRTPVIELNRYGDLFFHEEKLIPGSICKTLLRAGVRRGQEINIRVPSNADRRAMGHIAGELNKGGFTRIVFTTNREVTSTRRAYTGALPVQEPPPPPPGTRRLPH